VDFLKPLRTGWAISDMQSRASSVFLICEFRLVLQVSEELLSVEVTGAVLTSRIRLPAALAWPLCLGESGRDQAVKCLTDVKLNHPRFGNYRGYISLTVQKGSNMFLFIRQGGI
jgi:hypothetical protein